MPEPVNEVDEVRERESDEEAVRLEDSAGLPLMVKVTEEVLLESSVEEPVLVDVEELEGEGERGVVTVERRDKDDDGEEAVQVFDSEN